MTMDENRREYVNTARNVAQRMAERITVGNAERIVILSDDRDMGGDSIVIADRALIRYEVRTLRTLAVTSVLAAYDLTEDEARVIVDELCGL
jgi:hypothetical protein